jgi:hypothetical protein
MACRTTVGQPSANRAVGIEIARAVAFPRSLPVGTPEFSLEKLAAPANRTKRVASNDEEGRVQSIGIAPSDAGFLLDRLGDTGLRIVWGEGTVS